MGKESYCITIEDIGPAESSKHKDGSLVVFINLNAPEILKNEKAFEREAERRRWSGIIGEGSEEPVLTT